MRVWIMGALGVLGLSILALVGVAGYTAVGRARGEEWGSLDGPEPVWPAVIGFGAMYLIPLSALVVVVLVVIAIVRAYLPGQTRTPPDR